MSVVAGAEGVPGVTTRVVDLGQVRLHLAESGDPSGPPIVLLHGFPEFWYAWRHQIPPLAAAGRHVVAPDLRGYNGSDKPAAVAAYHPSRLVDDIARLLASLGRGPVTLVGHDWGGAIAWLFAIRHPALLARLVILNAPHPAAFSAALLASSQPLRSSYALFFQLPRLPEALLRARSFALFRRAFRYDPTHVDAFTDADIARYQTAWSQPGALTGGLNYYRAAARHPSLSAVRNPSRVDTPVLVIWGDRDRYLVPRLAEPPAPLVPNARVVHLPSASHWVMADEPDRVNELLLDL